MPNRYWAFTSAEPLTHFSLLYLHSSWRNETLKVKSPVWVLWPDLVAKPDYNPGIYDPRTHPWTDVTPGQQNQPLSLPLSQVFEGRHSGTSPLLSILPTQMFGWTQSHLPSNSILMHVSRILSLYLRTEHSAWPSHVNKCSLNKGMTCLDSISVPHTCFPPAKVSPCLGFNPHFSLLSKPNLTLDNFFCWLWVYFGAKCKE